MFKCKCVFHWAIGHARLEALGEGGEGVKGGNHLWYKLNTGCRWIYIHIYIHIICVLRISILAGCYVGGIGRGGKGDGIKSENLKLYKVNIWQIYVCIDY